MTENGILDLKDVGDWTRPLRRRRLNDVVGVDEDPGSVCVTFISIISVSSDVFRRTDPSGLSFRCKPEP